MGVDPIAFVVSGIRNQHAQQLMPAHGDGAAITVRTRIGEFELVFAAKTAAAFRAAAEFESS